LPISRFDKEKLRSEIRGKKEQLHEIKRDARAAKDRAERAEHRKRQVRIQQEIFQLRRKLGAAKEGRAEEDSETGALPYFVIIGASKCGTTFLYHLLIQHPYVESAAAKELHFFDILFEDEGVEWYRQCFPAPRWEEGRRTITGEATPMLAHLHAPERMARVVPGARLILLLRNPVDRAYSLYQHWVRSGVETLAFEEVIEDEMTRLPGAIRPEHLDDVDDVPFGYLSRSIYVDHLMRWSEYFPEERLLVLKSEDFFERPQEILRQVLEFLDLAEWEPESWESQKKRHYGRMDPSTRRRLEEYFEPHNRRLYDFLGTDFGW
jgi:hypothetical protein